MIYSVTVNRDKLCAIIAAMDIYKSSVELINVSQGSPSYLYIVEYNSLREDDNDFTKNLNTLLGDAY